MPKASTPPESTFLAATVPAWLNIQNTFDFDSLEKAMIERDVIPKNSKGVVCRRPFG